MMLMKYMKKLIGTNVPKLTKRNKSYLILEFLVHAEK